MDSPLSVMEREALSRFISKLIEDVDKLASLFEQRGADASRPRAAQDMLQLTLEDLEVVERVEIPLKALISDKV